MAPREPAAVEVFTNDDELFDRLVVVGADAIHTANPDKPALSSLATRIREGAVVGQVIPDADTILYSAISSVKANRHRDDLNIYHTRDAKTRMKNIQFAQAATRDRVLSLLARRLGPGFQRTDVQYGLFRAAVIPLLIAAALAAFTWLAYGAAEELAGGEEAVISGRARTEKYIFVGALNLLGPTGVAVVGGIIVIACLAWLAARVRTPPLMATLARR
jgi:hypothetical protein